MTVLSVDYDSEVLGFQTTFQAIIPQKRQKNFKVLFLLHGLYGNDKSWIQCSSIIRYVENRNLAVFMPNVHRSYYTDMKHGGNYWTFLTREFPETIESLFGLDLQRERTFVGGLSMGGYGALKWGLSEPQRFAKVFALSPAIDITRIRKEHKDREKEFGLIFGSPQDFETSPNSLYYLLDHGQPCMNNTSFLQICGREDPFYSDNLAFKKHIEKLPMPYLFKERDGGHSWDLWDEEIVTALDWMDNMER
ncbi:MAG: alpha/beta hydrolase family protein [Sporolactobacillus sp.]|uniref:alpha/beta hydrolase n=1 Tax=Sporolactobacillus sp. STSJ-5 TaxID=2965076 RepID=UPI002103BDD6|nr:alpha/beta hydrolase family protein [Sporolactobacillus sp. STSJ-5]MCQ2009458.1 esterase family protein [Sporolactobacillus sp. STSJ-5]